MIPSFDCTSCHPTLTTRPIIVRQGSIIFKLNGAVINVETDPRVTSGTILLQSEYAEVFYRRLELRLLRD